jgi:DNA mismatch repair protein MSH4
MTHKDIFKTMKKNGFRRQVKRKRRTKGSLDLQGKVADAGGEGGFGLEVDSSDEENQAPNNNNKSDQNDGVYGSRKSAAASVNTMRRTRLFDKKPPSSRAGAASTKGKSSQASMASSKNPYGRLKRSSGLSSSRAGSSVRSRVVNPRLPTAAVHIVCAIGENLARETCIASLDAGTPVSLQVTKQGNGQTYAETLAYLEILRPDEVLLNEGRRNSQLARKVLQLYGGDRGPLRQDDRSQKEDASADGPCESSTVVKFIPRSCFDQTKGAELLRRVARAETYDASVVEEYILLSSAHAVLHYTQQSLGATFSRNCLDLTINSGGNNRMAIDRSTLLQLELLTNAKTGKTRNSLIATIDCTKTTVGSRLLRTNLMAPPCRIDTINARLDLVDTFLADEEFFYTVHEQLQNLPDVDKMLTNVAIVPRKARSKQTGAGEAPVITERMASKGISALVCIKSTLTALPSFAMALYDQLSQIESEEGNDANAADAVSAVTDRSSLLIGLGGGPPSTKAPQRHHLLRAIIHAMRQPGLLEIVQAVSEIFTESTSFSRNANAMRHQECFALKSPDGMMDILRKAFLANVDDIYKKADEYAETHGIHVSVRYSSSRGYYLSVPGETASTLPQEFIQPAKSGNCIHCTTEEVQSLNTRAQDNVQDLLLMTYEKIKEVLDVARSKYDTLASLSDAVALLDLCHSFADNVTLSKLPWCRPVVSGEAGESLRSQDSDSDDDSGKIAIHNGRYGIDLTDAGLASADGPGEVIPNDTYATSAKNFTVISGINGSGKSTYLKQVAIIVLLAHCGSYVPAEQASIPVSFDDIR